MTYQINLNGRPLEIGRKEFLSTNDRLSAQWHGEEDPGRRRAIVSILYDLDKSMFKTWRVFGEENRKDYEQEAYFWLTRALETFKPGKGSFISWLKFYILKAQEEVAQAGRRTASHVGVEQVPETGSEERAPDALFWKRAKGQCTDEEWILLSARLLEGLPNLEAAQKADMHPERAKKLYPMLVQRLRIDIANQVHPGSPKNSSANCAVFTDEPIWVGKKWLRKRLELTVDYMKALLNPETPIEKCPWFIDPADTLPIQGGKIRYWETPTRGLVHPQFRRKRRNPLKGSEV